MEETEDCLRWELFSMWVCGIDLKNVNFGGKGFKGWWLENFLAENTADEFALKFTTFRPSMN